jgi:hypothetical protein
LYLKLIKTGNKKISLFNKYLFIFLLFFVYSHQYSQQKNKSSDNLVKVLLERGYENIRIGHLDKDLIVSYENRLYRFEVNALKDLFDILAKYVDEFDNLILVPQNRKIPLAEIKVSCYNLRAYYENRISSKEFGEVLDIHLNTDKIWGFLLKEEEINSSTMKFDFTIKPSFQFEFGPYSDPVLWQFNFMPGIKTNLWEGMQVSYEMIIPAYNSLSPRDDSVRTGLAVLNQTFRLPDDYFISSSIGYFSGYRSGLDFDAKKYFDNGNSNVYLNFGCTSFTELVGNRLYYSDQFLWTINAGFEYRIPQYDLTLGIMAGKFLMGDESIRFDINREFSEIEIGFFAIKSRDGISNGGINITIPIFPSKYWKPSFVRLRPDENFSISYLVKSSLKDLIGRRYNTGNQLDNFIKKLNPEFVKNRFLQDFN